MLRRAPVALAVVLALAGALARADDKDDPARALLASLAEKDPRLAGRSFFGVHAGRRNVGTLEVDIALTTSGSASYHARAAGRVALGDERAALEQTGLLDRRLAPSSLEERESEGGGSERPPLVRRIEAREDFFSLFQPTQGGEGKRTRLLPGRPFVEGLAARIAFLRALDAKKKATYLLCELDPETGALRDLSLDVTGTPDERLYPVVLHVPSSHEETRFLLDPEAPPARRVVRFARAKEPIEFVLAPDEAGARRDLPPAARPPEGSPRATILAYLEAAEQRDAKKLEELFDWAAFQRSLGEKGELDAWRKSFLEQFAAREGEHEHGERVPAAELIPKLKEDPLPPDALEARVRIEGEKGAFKLVRPRTDAPWRIAQLPD